MSLIDIFFWSFVIGGLAIGVVVYLYARAIKKADNDVQADPDKYLDQVFDGRQTAVYKVITFGGTLKDEQVIEGAEKRGYELHSQNMDTSMQKSMVFKKTA